MIASVFLDLIETHRVAVQLAVFGGMSYGLVALVAAVVRTASDRSRHAAFWSPPRLQLLADGGHSEAGRRRAQKRATKQHRQEYATTRARHTARTDTQPQPIVRPASLADTVPIGVIATLPDMYARTAAC